MTTTPPSIRRPLVATMCLAAGLAALALPPVVARAQSPASRIPMSSLGVPGRSNAHATVAADGNFVVVAWSAAHEKTTDVFVAASKDGGQSTRRLP